MTISHDSLDNAVQTKAALIRYILCDSLTLIYYRKVAGKYEH